MLDKLVLYDALYSLSSGDELYQLPNTPGYFGYRLEHCREVYVIFETLLENNWIYLHHNGEHIKIYRITEEGYKTYKEGVVWYNNLPWWKKLLGRIGFIF